VRERDRRALDDRQSRRALRVTKPGRWHAEGVAHAGNAEAILKAFAEANDEPLSPHQIAAATGMKPANVRKLMQSMKNDGLIKSAKYGKYVLNVCQG
jgi:biotin operon repressor